MITVTKGVAAAYSYGSQSVLVRMVGLAGSFKNVVMSTEADRRTSVDKAITQVLTAEQAALLQIAACESRANRILGDARKADRAMVRHTQERISRLHAGCAARTREMVAEMERKAAVETQRSPPGDREKDMLLAAVRALARDLTERITTDVG